LQHPTLAGLTTRGIMRDFLFQGAVPRRRGNRSKHFWRVVFFQFRFRGLGAPSMFLRFSPTPDKASFPKISTLCGRQRFNSLGTINSEGGVSSGLLPFRGEYYKQNLVNLEALVGLFSCQNGGWFHWQATEKTNKGNRKKKQKINWGKRPRERVHHGNSGEEGGGAASLGPPARGFFDGCFVWMRFLGCGALENPHYISFGGIELGGLFAPFEAPLPAQPLVP